MCKAQYRISSIEENKTDALQKFSYRLITTQQNPTQCSYKLGIQKKKNTHSDYKKDLQHHYSERICVLKLQEDMTQIQQNDLSSKQRDNNIVSVGEDVGGQEPSYAAWRKVNGYNTFGKYSGKYSRLFTWSNHKVLQLRLQVSP